MRRITLAMATAAALLVAGPARAQYNEATNFENVGTAQISDQREVTQRNIDMATKALKAGDYKTARKYAAPVTRSDPKRVESWLMLGTAQMGLQDWTRARTTYATALRLAPDNAEARAGMGVAMAWTKDPKAQEQLAWLAAKSQACGGGCAQQAQYAKLKGDVEAAIAAASKAS